MRLILVKPTNATRRLDTTGQVLCDDDREGCTSRAPHETSNGVIPSSKVSVQMPPLQTESVTISQLTNQDWLLLCGGEGADSSSSSAQDQTTRMGHPNDDKCACSCPGSQQHHSEESIFPPQSLQGCLLHKISLSSSPRSQFFPPSTQTSDGRQVFPHETNKRDLLQPANKYSCGSFMPRCINQQAQKTLSQQQICNYFKDANSNFNIPLYANERPEINRKLIQHSQPQDREKQHARYSVSGGETWKSREDPPVVLKCHHLSSNHMARTARVKRSSTPAKNQSVQSFSTSQYSSLDHQDLVEGETRTRYCQFRGYQPF
ncbi:uncharacterized protein LOC144062786 [Vanacampus margaritifer]